MINRIPETVHIIPVGEDTDRALRPFETVPVGRVVLISGAGDSAENDRTQEILAVLKKKHIRVEKIVPDSTDTAGLMKATAAAIRREKENGNNVYVNMSAAGKKGAAVATLAGMALGADVYYVPPQTGSIEILPAVEILLPEEDEVSVLQELSAAESLSASDIGDILDGDSFLEDTVLHEIDFSEERKIQSRNLMKVSSFMKKLEEKGYVSKGKTGRKMLYRITEKGRTVLLLTGI